MTYMLKNIYNKLCNKFSNIFFKKPSTKTHAILLSYSGVGYCGMKKYKGFERGSKSIEVEVVKALYRSGYVFRAAIKKPKAINFQSASTTGRNVSAMGQVCSVWIPEKNSIDLINKHLPENIRVLDIIRTTNSFSSRYMCDRIIYRYVCPTFAFAPLDYFESLDSFRASPALIEKLNQILMKYKGSHNFHNFTSRDISANFNCLRDVIDIKCDEPKMYKDVEYVTIYIKGESCLSSQIRKMVGLTIAVMKGLCDESVYDDVFEHYKYCLPMAPDSGLILDKAVFADYNRKCEKFNRGKIDWMKYEKEIDDFAEQHIYPNIYKLENEEKSMEMWLNQLLENPISKVELEAENL